MSEPMTEVTEHPSAPATSTPQSSARKSGAEKCKACGSSEEPVEVGVRMGAMQKACPKCGYGWGTGDAPE